MKKHNNKPADSTSALAPAVPPEAQQQVAPKALAVRPVSLKDGVALLPIEEQQAILEQYSARRKFFMDWLLKQLKPGVHYGVVPGCEPQLNDQGQVVRKQRDGTYVVVGNDQWRPRPSLYKVGAQFLVDLLKIEYRFELDRPGWEQLGSKDGKFVVRCTLHNPISGDQIGEGRGAFEVGEKQMNSNSAIKMAEKRALVDAVVNTIPIISELFTQDDNVPPPASPQPPGSPEAPTAPTRQQRAAHHPQPAAPPPAEDPKVVQARKALIGRWRAKKGDKDPTREHFLNWVRDETAGLFDPLDRGAWTLDLIRKLEEKLR